MASNSSPPNGNSAGALLRSWLPALAIVVTSAVAWGTQRAESADIVRRVDRLERIESSIAELRGDVRAIATELTEARRHEEERQRLTERRLDRLESAPPLTPPRR